MEIGLVAHSAALCVSCLTVCMLEIPSIVARLLPTYLEKFAKLSPTPQVAIPLLEFLS
ncbi:tuberin, partial [Paramuricea clavata]